MVILVLAAVLAAAKAVSTFMLAYQWETNDTLVRVYGVITIWFYVVAAATLGFFIYWLYGANTNLREMAYRPEFSKAATVYWWFVPFANFFVPFQVVKDVVEGARKVDDYWWEDRDPAPFWWGCLIGGWLLYFLSLQVQVQGSGVSVPLLVETVAVVALVVAAYFGVRLVSQVSSSILPWRKDQAVAM